MYKFLIALCTLIFVVIFTNFIRENYINFTNDIYAIRPPYVMAQKYDPNCMAPYRILKDNFLNHPIEGFENKSDPFSSKVWHKIENGVKMMQGENQDPMPQYPKMTEDEKNIRSMMKYLGNNKDVAITNNKVQKNSVSSPIKTDYQKDVQGFKFFDNEKCGDGYIPTGAYITGKGLTCNIGSVNENRECKAIAQVKNGKITKIEIRDPGSGYQNPSVEIIANDNRGIEGMAEVTSIGDNGSIQYIEVINNGKDYKNNPEIRVRNMGNNNKCYLCKKM